MSMSDSDALARRLRPLVSRLNHVERREANKEDLTETQASVLLTLRSRGPVRMGELAEIEGMAMPSMTDGIRRLEQLGHVRRVPGVEDRRVVNVEVTESGAELLASYIESHDGFYADRLSRLTRSERKSIAAAIDPLYKLLEEESEEED